MAATRDNTVEVQRQVEAYYFDWRAGRDQLQSQYDAAEKKEEFEYRKAKESVEAEFQRNMQVVEAGGPPSKEMLQQVMIDKRSLKLKVVENDYRETRSKMQAHFDKQLLEHTEKFSQGILEKLNPAAKYKTPQPSTLSAGRMPSSSAQPTTVPFYPSQVLPSNGESRFSVPERSRHPLYARYDTQPRPFGETDYARHSSQPRLHEEYSTPVGHDRRTGWTNSSHSSNSGDASIHHPLPSHHKILPSTPMSVEPERVVERLSTPGSAKRKSDTQVDGQSEQGVLKRTRSIVPHGLGDDNHIFMAEKTQDQSDQAQGPAGTEEADPPTPKPKKRTIDFNEVYQDGDAEYKHIIIRYPPGDDGKDEWWILKCDEHGVHFNLNPLHGAAKHLHSSQHNNMSKEHALAIRELGHMVWDCTRELAQKNNEAVRIAFEKGYKPFNRNQLTKTERRSMGFPDETIPVRKTVPSSVPQRKKVGPDHFKNPSSKEFRGIIDPVDAELYLGYWNRNKTRYVVMLLPWGSLAPTGIGGTLMSTGLLEKPPRCYTIDRNTREITGWAEGYEDGGRLVTKREFPVVYFDGIQSVGWLRANYLSLFNFEDPDARSIPFYKEARDYYAKSRPQKFESYQHMKEFYAANGLPPKLFSAVRQPPHSPQTPDVLDALSGADNAARRPEDKAPAPDRDGTKSPASEDHVSGNGHGGPVDVDMPDMSRADDTESYHDSALSDDPGSDDDVEMSNAESRRISISDKPLARENGPSTAASADKQTPQPPVSNSDVAAGPAEAQAKTTAMASPGTRRSVESVGHDSGKDSVPLVLQTTEDSSITLQEAADRVTNARTNGASAGHDSDSTPSTGSDSRKVVKIHARRSRSLRASESPSTGAATLATTGRAARSPSSPPAEDSIVHKGLAPAKTNTTVGGPRPGPLDVEKSHVSPVPQGEASVSHSEESAAPDRTHATAADEEQALQSAIAAEVTVATPVPTSKMSDSSSPISSPGSLSPTPIPPAASHTSSRTSTPAAVRPDETAQASRWRAVRGGSNTQGAATPQPREASSAPSAASPAVSARKEPPKEGSVPSAGPRSSATNTSRTSTPLPGRAGSEEVFEIAYYEDDLGGKFHKQKDGPFLRVVVDKQANTCETSPGQSTEVKVSPHDIARVNVNPLDDSPGAPCMVSLEMKDEAKGPKKQQLVFETSKAMGREEAGRIHARRFCAWVKRVNAAIDYRNHTYNSSRPATSYVRN